MKESRVLLVGSLLLFFGSVWSQGISLAKTSFLPGDSPATILTLGSAARVSIRVSSSGGVPISLHDRMEGLIARAGSQDAADGRIDISLDKGEYKVRLEGADPSGKPIGLTAAAYREINGDSSPLWPLLVPGKAAGGSLLDLQSASYWLRLREDGPLEVEALGRDLAAMEIWRDGQYLLESYAPREQRAVEEGRPMGWICASRQAKAGLYLVRLYGGASRAWPKEGPDHPLYVRAGFIGLPIGGRLDLTLSPFGRDFIVVEGADRAVMTRRDKGDSSIFSSAYSPGRDRLSAGNQSRLSKSGTVLSCAVDLPPGRSLIRVEGKPGETLLLDVGATRALTLIPGRDLRSGGLLTVSAPRGDAPQLEVTGIAYRMAKGAEGDRAVVAKDFCVPLSGSASIRRRCNIGTGGDLSLYIRVEEEGSYRIAEKGGLGQAAAAYRMELLDPGLRDNARASAAPAGKGVLELTKGYYRLSISALGIGVLDFLLYKDAFARVTKGDLDRDPPEERDFYAWAFDPDPSAADLYVLLGRGPSFGAGASYEPFPLALGRGLGIELGPGEKLSLPFIVKSPGRFRWASKGGTLSLDGQSIAEGAGISPGGKQAQLGSAGSGAGSISFAIEPSFEDLPPPAQAAFATGLSALSADAPVWRDFGVGESAVYAFEVEEPAVYAIESLGRLSTSLVVRTASRVKLFDAAQNGHGRNASISAWLRRGQYYVEVATRGASKGRAGLRMNRVPLLAQAAIAVGTVDRRALPADSAVRFGFGLTKAARVDLYSVGLSRAFPVRLEDKDGFIVYSGPGKAAVDLDPGSYSLYSLPVSIDTNRLTWIAPREAPAPVPPIAGTRALAFNSSVAAVWNDDSQGDRYSFSLAADLPRVSIRMPVEFEASLLGPDGTRELPPEARSGLALRRGTYLLTLRHRDKASRLPYSIGLATDSLAPGIPARIAVGDGGATVSVSVPVDGFYELWSLGTSDIAARLVREVSLEEVARADDNGPDWNIDIVQRLKAGLYRLELSSLSGGESPVDLTLVSRDARLLGGASSSFESRVDLDAAGVLLPFDTKSEEGLFLVSSDGDSTVSFRVYRGEELLAAADGRMAIPLRKDSQYSIYAWSPLAAVAKISVKRLPEKSASLAKAFSLESGGVARLQNDEALSAKAVSGSLLVSAGFELPCVDPGSSPFSTLGEGGWAWAPDSGASAEPLVLSAGEGAVLDLGAADQGFTTASADKVILLAADTRGQFRCGISALPAAKPGAAPYDWNASAAWSQGSVALLPPGNWKGRVWDGERGSGTTRRIGVGADYYELASLPALAMGGRDTLSLAPGKAVAMDLPDCTLSALLGEGIVLSAWKDGEALATRTGLDGRATEALSVTACRLFLANRGGKEESVRLAVLPPRAQAEDKLSAARPYEAVDPPPEGIRLKVEAGAQELLCLAGDAAEAVLETGDGRYLRVVRDASAGLFTSVPASSGSIWIRSSGGIVRAWLAKSGKEIDGLLDQDRSAAGRELKDAAVLSGKGDAFRFNLASAGYVDLSCPGPGVLALSGAGPDARVLVSGSRDDMHLFAWLPAGEYGLWQRPARGAASGGIIRLDRIESRRADAESLARRAFIGAGEYQAWSFSVSAKGLVGVGVEADADGLEGFLYDSRQGLVAKGKLVFATLEAGEYLFVVKGLDAAPMEYGLALEGNAGSRLGVPSEVLDSYKAQTGGGKSVAVPLRSRGSGAEGPGNAERREDGADGEQDPDDGGAPQTSDDNDE
jgi:hypothetical protein